MILYNDEDEQQMQVASIRSTLGELEDKIDILAIQLSKLQELVTKLAQEVSKEPSKYEFKRSKISGELHYIR